MIAGRHPLARSRRRQRSRKKGAATVLAWIALPLTLACSETGDEPLLPSERRAVIHGSLPFTWMWPGGDWAMIHSPSVTRRKGLVAQLDGRATCAFESVVAPKGSVREVATVRMRARARMGVEIRELRDKSGFEGEYISSSGTLVRARTIARGPVVVMFECFGRVGDVSGEELDRSLDAVAMTREKQQPPPKDRPVSGRGWRLDGGGYVDRVAGLRIPRLPPLEPDFVARPSRFDPRKDLSLRSLSPELRVWVSASRADTLAPSAHARSRFTACRDC